ncbi:MAG: hypothetical protein J6Y03_02985 [Alphaproteobacteria bacterium]|nr:hypothetical protein [Alphaproteobacteria bacterium]
MKENIDSKKMVEFQKYTKILKIVLVILAFLMLFICREIIQNVIMASTYESISNPWIDYALLGLFLILLLILLFFRFFVLFGLLITVFIVGYIIDYGTETQKEDNNVVAMSLLTENNPSSKEGK